MSGRRPEGLLQLQQEEVLEAFFSFIRKTARRPSLAFVSFSRKKARSPSALSGRRPKYLLRFHQKEDPTAFFSSSWEEDLKTFCFRGRRSEDLRFFIGRRPKGLLLFWRKKVRRPLFLPEKKTRGYSSSSGGRRHGGLQIFREKKIQGYSSGSRGRRSEGLFQIFRGKEGSFFNGKKTQSSSAFGGRRPSVSSMGRKTKGLLQLVEVEGSKSFNFFDDGPNESSSMVQMKIHVGIFFGSSWSKILGVIFFLLGGRSRRIFLFCDEDTKGSSSSTSQLRGIQSFSLLRFSLIVEVILVLF